MLGTNIGFIYPLENVKQEDEIQFDVRPDERIELALCWFEFCKENEIIQYIEEVEVDDE